VKEPTLGFAVLHARRCGTDTAAHEAALALFMSTTWSGPMRYMSALAVPGRGLARRPRMISAKQVTHEVGLALRDPDLLKVTLRTGREVGDGYRRITWENGMPSDPLALTYGDRPLSDLAADAWVTDVVTYADAVSASAGVVTVMAERDEITSECSTGVIGRGDGIAHPWPEQVARMKGDNARYIGTRYMRFPRWGTLVSHDHVAALGGVDVIAKAVEPAVVRPLSGGVYFQLTAWVATAMGDEAMAKQRAFTELAAPLTPPPLTPPG
jgi:hypothetical protein